MKRWYLLIFLLLLCIFNLTFGFEYDDSASDGPSLWGTVYPECAGFRQSPVDIVSSTVDSGAIEFLRLSAPFAIVNPLPFTNNGHTVLLNLTTRNMRLVGSTFPDSMDAIQCHFHTPSEHTVDGVHYDMELHLVHGCIDRSSLGLRYPMAVIGLLFSMSAQPAVDDPLVKHLVNSLPYLGTVGNTVNINLLPSVDIGTEFWEYDGSLTTPPCYEVVHWLVSTKIRYVSPAMLTAFQQIIGNNSRPVQILNGRRITRRTMASLALSKYTSCYTSSISASGSSATTPGQSVTTINFEGLFDGVQTPN